ncbi:prostaglandin F2-alpha receptor [Lampris incognitus]|uniref:prostaglandin F2-alpha receptor n=1 Tax=Lampris incognitus TaxID=2546036 RepID=UPI0024B61950|nr:prostaglandin F2-alpha receptor [Lampris incognitus]
MSANGSSEAGCRSQVRASNTTYSPKDLSITTSAIAMTVGILSNSLALFILLKSYHAIRTKYKAPFLLFASSLVVTNLLGHLINGSLLLFVHSSHRRWETFDPHCVLCSFFGVCMVFFGLSPLLLSSAMAVERCMGVTRPLFHSTVVVPRHVKRLLGLIWLFAALVAILPVLLLRPYQVQHSGSWCFFQIGKPRDWRDRFLPIVFSVLGLLALLLSIVFNTLTSCSLLQARLSHKHHCRGTSYHLEMICQLLAIMLVCCICWGPLLIHVIILSARGEEEPSSSSLLLVHMATWSQILDPWVYILLRKAVLKKLCLLLHRYQGPKSPDHH